MFRGHVILSAKNLCKGISNSRDSGREGFSTGIQRIQIWLLRILHCADHHDCFMAGYMTHGRTIKALPTILLKISV